MKPVMVSGPPISRMLSTPLISISAPTSHSPCGHLNIILSSLPKNFLFLSEIDRITEILLPKSFETSSPQDKAPEPSLEVRSTVNAWPIPEVKRIDDGMSRKTKCRSFLLSPLSLIFILSFLSFCITFRFGAPEETTGTSFLSLMFCPKLRNTSLQDELLSPEVRSIINTGPVPEVKQVDNSLSRITRCS